MPLTAGTRLGPYEVVRLIGAGGMGEVYEAKDTRLDRTVAIKVLPPGFADANHRARFEREARTIGGLSHPHICTLFDVGEHTSSVFLVMEHLAGETLAERLRKGALPIPEALEIGAQIADALSTAHRAGIVHRDLKPGNIMLTTSGVKLLDFGLAKLTEPVVLGESEATVTVGLRTQEGVIVGTVAYMSPEQAEGKPVDTRSDVFSFGVLLYEMAAGQRPFQGDSSLSTLTAILHKSPVPLNTMRREVPADLERIVFRSLEKRPDSRYPSAVEVWTELKACQSRLATPGLKSLLRKPRFAIPALLLLLAIVGVGTWFSIGIRRVRWARNVALPEIARLARQRETTVQAFGLARQAQQIIPEDSQLQQLWRDATAPVTIRTIPAGAVVAWKDYTAAGDSDWESLGLSPIEGRRVPNGYLRWRLSKEGFDPVEVAFSSWTTSVIQFKLDPQGSTPPGMVRVPGGDYTFGTAPPVQLEDYWLDKYEVTNRQFKGFVDAGGYRKREYWKHPFVQNGEELPLERAIGEFRDTTGRPGPATWELGSYADGQADFPVGGVSWYEAAAFAEFTGKSLPTVYHWHKAADVGIFSDIARLSNFGSAPARVGSFRGMSPYGAYDMAGNVKEWCWNESGSRRYLLGGSWGEPAYMFADPDAQSPLRRLPPYGIRLAKYARPVADSITAPITEVTRDFTKEKPASDEAFRLYENLYAYDHTPLNAVIESVDNSSEHWRKERISFQAAYGTERVTAYLFLPNNAALPYQTVVHFPGGYAVRSNSSENLSVQFVDFIIRSGRALLYPIYKGTYERGGGLPFGGTSAQREVTIQQSRDLRRGIDYLETRHDIDRDRLAFYGFSFGARLGPIFTALEPRFKTSVLLSGGFPSPHQPPEVDEVHFAPRARMPVLMLNGRHDFLFPLETSQKPLFRLLGAPEKDKRHILLDSGHFPFPMQDAIKEILDWLDHYLGPVKTK